MRFNKIFSLASQRVRHLTSRIVLSILRSGLCSILCGSALIAGALAPISAARAGSSVGEREFNAGIESFKKNDLNSAAKSFAKVVITDPDSTVALHNLALVEWKANHPGFAIALWRRALAINGTYEPAQVGIAWVKNKLDHTEISHEVEYWESFRSGFLNGTSLTVLVVLTAALLLTSGWLLLGFYGARRRALQDGVAGPAFPITASVIGALFVLFLILSVAKVYDSTVERGTIVVKKIEARSAPDLSSTPLFDLYEGLEVIIDQAPSGWLQVTYPGGPTGWIPAASLLRTAKTAPITLPELATAADKKPVEPSPDSPSPQPSAAPDKAKAGT